MDFADADLDEDVTPYADLAVDLEVDPHAGRLFGNPTVRMRVFDAATGELVAEEAGDAGFELAFDHPCDDAASCSATYEIELTLDSGARARVEWVARVQVGGRWFATGRFVELETP